MRSRTFKVMEPMMGLTGSELRFRGQWLKSAGFHPGAMVRLDVKEPGVIELRVESPAQLTAKDFTAAIERFEKLQI